jgi:ABC-2 type transport system ATP-binding protein
MLIQVKNLSKSFKIFKREPGIKGAFKSFLKRDYHLFHALQNINLNVDKGEILGILGENGAGKTTLIKLIIGLLHPTSGTISVDNYTPWERNHDYLRQVSVVMGQKNQLWWDIPASESFLLNKHIYQIDNKQYEKVLSELVELLDIKDKLNIQVRRLSLGERMKMEIIAALLHQPRIVLLDEPTLGLDVISQSKIREFVKYHNEQYKTTFVITSHYTKDIQEMCERVFVLNKGEQIYDGDFNNLIKSVNPKRKFIYELPNDYDSKIIEQLNKEFDFTFKDNVITAELSETILNDLLIKLLAISSPKTLSFEDLPVEETLRSFFANPTKYLK